MSRKTLTIIVIALGILFIALGGIAAANVWFNPEPKDAATTTSPTPTVTQSSASAATATVTYVGVEGQTALALLQQKYPDTQVTGTGVNAYVTSINGYTADDAKKEYWAFYVNGKMADVGAGTYTTKTGDTVEWKIATY